MKNASKFLLYDRGNLWRKKRGENNDSLFDVGQGSYLRAELCELVGLFVLSGFNDKFGGGNVRLYHDDGTMVLPNCSGSKEEKLKANTCLL